MMGGMMTPLLSKILALLRRMLADRSGATAVEYALLATVLALSITVGVATIGDAAVELLTIPAGIFSSASG